MVARFRGMQDGNAGLYLHALVLRLRTHSSTRAEGDNQAVLFHLLVLKKRTAERYFARTRKPPFDLVPDSDLCTPFAIRSARAIGVLRLDAGMRTYATMHCCFVVWDGISLRLPA